MEHIRILKETFCKLTMCQSQPEMDMPFRPVSAAILMPEGSGLHAEFERFLPAPAAEKFAQMVVFHPQEGGRRSNRRELLKLVAVESELGSGINAVFPNTSDRLVNDVSSPLFAVCLEIVGMVRGQVLGGNGKMVATGVERAPAAQRGGARLSV